MKLYKLSFLAIITMFLFVTCNKETEGLSRSTYYVAFEILGENPTPVQYGDPYDDLGVKATMRMADGTVKDVTSQVKVTGIENVDINTMGMYYVTYTSPPNEDGLISKAVRTVIVCNPSVTTDLSGKWKVIEDSGDGDDGTHRVLLSTGAITPYGTYANGAPYEVEINRLAPGFFSISDFLAGWYSIRTYPQYAPASAMIGNFAMNEDNTLFILNSFIGLWEDGLDFFDDAVYDPDNNTLYWKTGYAGSMHFYIYLTK